MTYHAPLPLSRRRLLQGLLAAGAVGALGGSFAVREFAAAASERTVERRPDGYHAWHWDDPRAWPDGRVPGPGDVAMVTRPIMVDGSRTVAGIDITPAGALVFAPHASTQIETRGNVVVRGRLSMRPDVTGRHAVPIHTLRFVDVDESRYVGGHTHHPLDTDVGLWVVEGGVLDAHGTPKLPWTRLDHSVSAGDTTLTLPVEPHGWQSGDAIVVVPTEPGSHTAYSQARVTQFDGRTVTLDAPLEHDHPAFTHDAIGQDLGAEVLNLTRNVRIEGTPEGRAHTQFLHTRHPQLVEFVEYRHLGPRQDTGRTYLRGNERVPIYGGVRGRYPVHFHMCGDGSRGSNMTGCVARDVGHHGFVTHLSNGVTHVDGVIHDVLDDAWWWDPREMIGKPDPPSDDVRYERCVASLVRSDPPFEGTRLAGFNLLAGTGNAAVGCVAVGVLGNRDASGFLWPEGPQAAWIFQDCIAHNNARHGIFGWQNSALRHTLERFVCYRNGGYGVSHGAYRNRYLFRDALCAENRQGPFLLHAVSASDEPLELANMVLDASGATFALEATKHNRTLLAEQPTHVHDCTLTGYAGHAYGYTYDGSDGTSGPDKTDLTSCAADNTRKTFMSDYGASLGSQARWISDGSGASLRLHFPLPE